MRALLLLLLGAVPVLAQGKKEPTFVVPKPKPEKEPDEATDQSKALRKAVQRLAGWPAERSRRAAEQLIVQREKSQPLVLAILVSEDRKHDALKPGAAYVLGRIGDRAHFLTLLLVAAEKKQHRHAAVFLEAAYRLNRDAAVAEAFRFFHLSDTTLRREAAKFVRDRLTKKNVEAVLELLDKRIAERPFTREIGLSMLDRLVASGEVAWKEVGQRFYGALGDESPQVASRSVRILASRNDEENIGALNALITKKYSYWRQRSYAALSLSILSSAFKVQPLAPETIAMLQGTKGLDHPRELLAQAAAALALGESALRSGDKQLVRLLDKRIPIILIEAVGAGNRHYRDFGSVMPLAYTMLRKITGQVFPDHAPQWARWWRDNGRRFRARRELREVEKADLPEAMVEVKRARTAGGEAIRLMVVGERRPTFLHGRAYALPQEEMAALIGLLREMGFFGAGEPDPARIGEDEALVVVRVGDLARTVAFAPGQVLERIQARADALAEEYAWQLWWDRAAHPSWALFFGENRKWFFEHADPKERVARQRAMIAASLDDLLLLEDRLRAARDAAALPGGGKALTQQEIKLFVKAVSIEREPNAFVAAILDLLVPDAGPAAADGLIDALAAKPDPRALDLLTHLCTSLEVERLGTLGEDERWKVRRAAVGALAARAPEDSRPGLVKRLEDEEVSVRAAAAEALARRKDRAVLPTLQELAGHASSEVRATTAYAYGLLGGAEGLSAIRPLLYRDERLRVRRRAIAGLVEGTDPGAADLLIGVFERETDSTVRATASSGLVALESASLVRKLMTRLQHTPSASPERVAIVNVLARFKSNEPLGLLQAVLAGDDLMSADAAALGLARRWDDASIGQLIRMTEAGRNARAAIRHLQIISSYANEEQSFERQASNYKGWYRVNSTGNPRSWFRDALTQRGYDTMLLREFVDKGEALPNEAIPLLLRALRDQAWYLRRNASYLLGVRIGEGAPDPISYNTLPSQAEKAIRAYNDWWVKETKRIEDEERG